MATNNGPTILLVVVDKIGQVSGELFTSLDRVGRAIPGVLDRIRLKQQPWGGVQLIVAGDFFSAEPVPKEKWKRRTSVNTRSFEAAILRETCMKFPRRMSILFAKYWRQSDSKDDLAQKLGSEGAIR